MKVVSELARRNRFWFGNHNQRIDMLLQLREAGFRGTGAASAFECERLGAHADGQNAFVARGLGDHRRSASAGAAAHAGSDEAHVRALERRIDLIERLFGGGAADLRPRAGAKPLRDLEPELDPPVRERGIERLSIGVGDHEVDALDVGAHHVGDGVAARTANSDHADPRPKFINFRPDEIDAHDLNSPQSDNALSLHGESLNHPESHAKRKS